MELKNIIIASSKKWFSETGLQKILALRKVIFVTNQLQLTEALEKSSQFDFLFFIHWNWKVEEKIIANHKCICFHTAPLPFGRGGSPIQNLILNGFKESPINAIIMEKTLDTGPVLISKIVSLEGSLSEIFRRMKPLIITMIIEILTKKINPVKQKGQARVFKRITFSENEIPKEISLDEFYDRIRMIDDNEYPNSFIKYGNFLIEFYDAKMINNEMLAKIKIVKN